MATGDETDFSPMSGAPLWIAGFLLALANFMVRAGHHHRQRRRCRTSPAAWRCRPSQGTWVITSYAVAEAITVPLTGWLAQRFGAVRCSSSPWLGFGVCSALCGFAPSLGALVVFRVLQGLSGGPIMPL